MSTATIANTIADASARLQDKASDAFRAGRVTTADALDGAASRVNAGGDRVAQIAHSTADSLGAGATYVRENDGRDMIGDIESLIKAHPGKFLIGAAVVGFLAGRAELHIAVAELRDGLEAVGGAAVFILAGTACATLAAAFLLLSLLFALMHVMPTWLAALLIAGAMGGGAAVLLVAGRARIPQSFGSTSRQLAPLPGKPA